MFCWIAFYDSSKDNETVHGLTEKGAQFTTAMAQH